MATIGTPTVLGSNSAQNTSSDLVVTLSRAINPNCVALLVVNQVRGSSTAPPAPTASGGATTWTSTDTVNYKTAGTYRAKATVFRMLEASPSGTSVTVALSGVTHEAVYAVVIEVGNCITSGTNGLNALVQHAFGSAQSNSNSATVAMNTLADTTNNGFLVLTATMTSSSRTYTPDSTYSLTELFDTQGSFSSAGYALNIHCQYKIGLANANPTLTANYSGSVDASVAYGVEIGAATAAGNQHKTAPAHLQQTRRVAG